ncbi:MAG TPA: M23 family metallopeptidase [bacterium]|jgi:murein DD-endopeptidase MepM/ murein hydrolase activator NlpD|nr:M23 family metallopeptidase [bacterium]
MPGNLLTWSNLQDKQALAAYLTRTVRQADFEVEIVTVKKRQSYWTLAKQAKLNIGTIIGFNPDMQHLNAYVGRPLLLPNQRGSLYQVGATETAESIEKDYGLLSGTVRAANQVGWLGLSQGQVLFLPGVAPKQLTAPMQEIFAKRDFFRSPLAGHYTSMMGKRVDPFTGVTRFHNGVDIGAPFNSLVGAAADGTVVLAGWNGGFGKCVIIKHAQGYRTLYGHLNAILVHVGQKVKQHQLIGRVGMTGRTTGPHLHFTIWKNDRVQNPLNYLW